MTVMRASARPTRRGAAANFTGEVWQDEVVVGTPPSRMRATSVTFNPGARTAWHKHPVGQTLYVLYGSGRVCKKGDKPIVINPGDTVMIPPDVVHWHGAAADRLMIHLAMSEVTGTGEGTVWLEKVTDAEYAAEPSSSDD